MGPDQRTPRVGLLLRGGSYAYQDQIVIGTHQECKARGVDLYVLSGGIVTAADPRNFVYTLAGAGQLDAIVMVKGTMGAGEGDPTIRALLDGLRPLPTCIIGPPEPGVPCVAVDNASGVRALTRHLLQKHGLRRVAFVTGLGREAEQRLAGYRAAHQDCDLAVDERLVVAGDYRFTAGQNAVTALFERGGGCDGLVTANDWMALGALEALRLRGLRVPEDVAVVGFDDVEEARFATPPLTTVRQSPRQMGIEAVRLVLAQLGGDPVRGDVMLDALPQIRQSCGCFRGTRRDEAGVPQGGPSREPGTKRAPDYAAWIEATAATGPGADPSLPRDWAARLVDALRRDLDGATSGHSHFLGTLDAVVGGAEELGNVSAWHHPIATLRREVLRDLGAAAGELALAESIFERAHILIGDHAERTQGRRRLETEGASRTLEELGTDVRTSLDRPSIGRALASHLPGLHVQSCAVVLQAGDTGRAPAGGDEARLIISWDERQGLRPVEGGVPFQAGALVPDGFRPPHRHTLMVEPLCFQSEALGWCLLEMDPPRATVCEAIPAQISASLKAAALQERLIAEATKRERAERARLTHEIELAARLQVGILPRDCQVSRLDVATAMIPATEVGGDYFDILPFAGPPGSPGGAWLGIGDVTGHGLDAGLMMLMIQSIVSAVTHDRPDASPAQVWAVLNDVLHDNVRARLARDDHATLTLLRYEDSGRFVYAGAHEDILIHRAETGRCTPLRTRGVWAGVTRDLAPGAIGDDAFQLAPGDTVVLYTDGILEARNARRELFGPARLRQALEEAAGGTVDEVRDHLLAAVRGFMSTQADDLTLVVLRYR